MYLENSATNKLPCREFSYIQVTLCRVQLQTNHPMGSLATSTVSNPVEGSRGVLFIAELYK